MRALAALYRLGLDLSDVAAMKRDLRRAIERANTELLNSFRS